MGDFYELFFEDAEIASAALGIVLTKRGKHLGQDIRMCGVPIHAAKDYLNKLIRLGHRVAICEQVEDPAEAKKRGGKSVVKRDVVRLITAGTSPRTTISSARPPTFSRRWPWCAMAIPISPSPGPMSRPARPRPIVSAEQLQDELARIDPAELLTEATRWRWSSGISAAVAHQPLSPAEVLTARLLPCLRAFPGD